MKVFFQPGVNINAALAQIDRRFADGAQIPAARNYAALRPQLQRFERACHPTGAVEQIAVTGAIVRRWARISSGHNSPQVAGTAIPSPYGGKILQVQVDIDQQKLQAYGLSAEDVVNAIGQQNIVTPVGTEKVGDFEYVVSLNGSPTGLDELNDLPIRVVDGTTIFLRDVAYAHFGAPPQINMVRVDG